METAEEKESAWGASANLLFQEIFESHRALSRVHDNEVRAVRERLNAMNQQAKRTFDIMERVGGLAGRYEKILTILESRHQDVLNELDKQWERTLTAYIEKNRSALTGYQEAIAKELEKNIGGMLKEMIQTAQMQIQGIREKLDESSHNTIQDLDKVTTGVHRLAENWKEVSMKLYWRVLVLTAAGGFMGVIAALIATKWVRV